MSKNRRAKMARGGSLGKKRGRDNGEDATGESRGLGAATDDGDRPNAAGGGADHDHDRSDEDWIAALASSVATASAQTQTSSSASSRPPAAATTKAQRIERRNAKRLEREERIRRKKAQRREREEAKWRGNTDGRRPVDRGNVREAASAAARGSARDRPDAEGPGGGGRSGATHAVRDLERRVRESVSNVEQRAGGGGGDNGNRPYVCPDSLVRGKATRTRPSDSDTAGRVLQPRRRDYGGLGLARPSLYVPLRDPSFVPRLEEEFAEHVDGFFGRQRTKAMKRQNDGNMLWRRCLARRRGADRGGGAGEERGDAGRAGDDGAALVVGGRRLADMTPDERVEAMISAGII